MSDSYSGTFDERAGQMFDNSSTPTSVNDLLAHAQEATPPSLKASPTTNPTSPFGDPNYLKTAYEELDHAGQGILHRGRDVSNKMIGTIEDSQRTLASRPVPQLGKMPEEPKAQLGQGLMEFMQVATVLGAMAGGMARGNATIALTAFSGAVKGFTQGKEQEFKDNIETWRAATDRMIGDNQAKLDQYDLILRNDKLSAEMKMSALKIAAAQNQDEMTYNVMEQKNLNLFAQMNQKENQFQQKMTLDYQKLNNDTLKIQAIIDARNHPNLRSGTAMAAQEFRDEWKANHNGQEPPSAEMSKFNAKQAAQRSAMTNWEGNGKGAQAMQSVGTALQHLDVIQELSTALGNKDMRGANRLFQAIGQEFGVAAPVDFDAAMTIVGPEIVKAVVAGGGGQAERQQAEGLLTKGSSPQQIAGVVAALKKLFVGQLSTHKRRFMKDTGEGEEEFNDRIGPQAVEMMNPSKSPAQGGGDGGWSIVK